MKLLRHQDAIPGCCRTSGTARATALAGVSRVLCVLPETAQNQGYDRVRSIGSRNAVIPDFLLRLVIISPQVAKVKADSIEWR